MLGRDAEFAITPKNLVHSLVRKPVSSHFFLAYSPLPRLFEKWVQSHTLPVWIKFNLWMNTSRQETSIVVHVRVFWQHRSWDSFGVRARTNAQLSHRIALLFLDTRWRQILINTSGLVSLVSYMQWLDFTLEGSKDLLNIEPIPTAQLACLSWRDYSEFTF